MKKEKPKKKRPSRSLEDIERERRDRRYQEMQKRFDSTIQHMTEIEKMNKEYVETRKNLTQAAKTTLRKDGKGRS